MKSEEEIESILHLLHWLEEYGALVLKEVDQSLLKSKINLYYTSESNEGKGLEVNSLAGEESSVGVISKDKLLKQSFPKIADPRRKLKRKNVDKDKDDKTTPKKRGRRAGSQKLDSRIDLGEDDSTNSLPIPRTMEIPELIIKTEPPEELEAELILGDINSGTDIETEEWSTGMDFSCSDTPDDDEETQCLSAVSTPRGSKPKSKSKISPKRKSKSKSSPKSKPKSKTSSKPKSKSPTKRKSKSKTSTNSETELPPKPKREGHENKSRLCTICGKVFTKRLYLQNHLVVHKNERPFLCDQCPKSYKIAWKLTLHQRTHNNIRPYVCPICNKSFTQKNRLDRHSVVHSDDRPFQCSFCPKAFRRDSHLRSHELVHSSGKVHKCEPCGKAYVQIGSLNFHMNTQLHKEKVESLKSEANSPSV